MRFLSLPFSIKVDQLDFVVAALVRLIDEFPAIRRETREEVLAAMVSDAFSVGEASRLGSY